MQTFLLQILIQLRKGLHFGHGRQEVAPCVAHVALHAAFLMSLTRRAVVALKQVIASEGNKCFLFLTVAPFQDPVHRGLVEDPDQGGCRR